MLKVATRKLFLRGEDGMMKDISILCLLDFYVHEASQRRGQGRRLFEEMLRREGGPDLQAYKLAYDKPSIKLMGFLAKHYSLRDHMPQNNNFVVFR